MFFPAVLNAGQIKTRTVTVPLSDRGTYMVYQDSFDAEKPLSAVIRHVLAMAPEGRDIQEIKVTRNG
jgi:hypothetical protein